MAGGQTYGITCWCDRQGMRHGMAPIHHPTGGFLQGDPQMVHSLIPYLSHQQDDGSFFGCLQKAAGSQKANMSPAGSPQWILQPYPLKCWLSSLDPHQLLMEPFFAWMSAVLDITTIHSRGPLNCCFASLDCHHLLMAPLLLGCPQY